MEIENTYTAFAGNLHIATGDLKAVLSAALTYARREGDSDILFFHNRTGRQTDFDLRGTEEEVITRAIPPKPKKGPGRPRLGVVCGEVCLLPRHWEWLDSRPKKASGTIRRLVEQARKQISQEDRLKERIEAAHRFMWATAGNFIGFEEASRALYAGKWAVFDRLTAFWPKDITEHLNVMLEEAKSADVNAERKSFSVLPRLEPSFPSKESGEPWKLGALELAVAVSRGEYSAGEVVESYLRRIEEVNDRINAVTELFAEDARAAAAEVDRLRAAGEKIGPLAGVPFTVKGNIDVAGKATSSGVPAMKDAVPSRDAPLVRRLRDAGAIPLGHTNLPDLSLRFHTSSSLYGATKNPWDEGLSPGGSSGGEGAAIAAGMSALGIGNDAGGSVRIPANFCAVAGFKPTYGRLPSDRDVGPRDLSLASQLIPVEGLLARSVADLHIAYQILAGPDPRDPRVPPVPLFLEEPSASRIAVVEDPGGLGVHPEVRRAVARAAEVLAKEGYEVVEADLPSLAETTEAYDRLIMTEVSRNPRVLDGLLGPEGRKYIGFALGEGKPADLDGYILLTSLRQKLIREWTEFFEKYPVALGPVFTEEIIPPDYDIQGVEEYREVARGMRLCSATSFIGLPAVSVPTAVSDGRPRGVQVIAGLYREDRCFEAASILEAAAGRFSPPEKSF